MINVDNYLISTVLVFDHDNGWNCDTLRIMHDQHDIVNLQIFETLY